MPTSATTSGPTGSEYATVAVDTRLIQASATACIVSPVPMISRALILSDRAPARGAMNIGRGPAVIVVLRYL